jgi:hypothetical protein
MRATCGPATPTRERQITAGRLTMEEFSAWAAAVYRVAHDV